MSGRLADKVAIVVGAGQSTPGESIGNGRATAIRFAQEGARVLLVDRDAQSLTETAELIADSDGATTTLVADVSDEADCEHIVSECAQRFGRIDILHNNVGGIGGDGDVESFDTAVWDRIMAVNARGMALTCKYALPVMRTEGSGSIINISSVVSVVGHYPLVAYKMSKAAVNALTQHVAALGASSGVRANAILVGRIATPAAVEGVIRDTGTEDRDARIEAMNTTVPLQRRAGTAWDVASAAVFFASDEARFITGAVLPVDGGESAALLAPG